MNQRADQELRVISDWRDLRAEIQTQRRAGRTVGLVPTMGALHDGHLSLVRESRRCTDITVVTVFVNPTQFGPCEDLARYPRTLTSDLELLRPLGVKWVLTPPEDQVYPADFSTYVEPPQVARRLEGECRPGHFRGVATVVLKLFNMVPVDIAFFGQKDYQQSLVIRRMVVDLNLPVRIQVCPTIREPDGLALSSRNRYLSPADRDQGLVLSRSLSLAQSLVSQGERSGDEIRGQMRNLFRVAGVEQIDYISLAEPETLTEIDFVNGPFMALVAAHIGTTRLIDNRRIEPT